MSKPTMNPPISNAHNQAIDGSRSPRMKLLLNMANTMTPVSSQCGELSSLPKTKPMIHAAENSSQNRGDRKVKPVFTQKNCT